MREFPSGATRDVDTGKFDFEGFLSPQVVERFGAYMHKHRFTPLGVRSSDNWQKGIPIEVYMKSMWRHFFAVWKSYRAGAPDVESLCAVLFNVQGMMHEVLKQPVSVDENSCGMAAEKFEALTKTGKHCERRINGLYTVVPEPANWYTENIPENIRKYLCTEKNCSGVLGSEFAWGDSPDGYGYWSGQNQRLLRGEGVTEDAKAKLSVPTADAGKPKVEDRWERSEWTK